jgi:hypothetical protein
MVWDNDLEDSLVKELKFESEFIRLASAEKT